MRHLLTSWFRQSLRIQLNLSIAAAVLVVALMAYAYAFVDSYLETQEFQDDLLKQTAAYIQPDMPFQRAKDIDGDVRIFADTPAQPAKRDIGLATLPAKDGFYDLKHDDDIYRVYVRYTEQGRVAVWQEDDFRRDFAFRAANNSALPLLLLIPAIIAITFLTTRRALRPIVQLSQHIATRQDSDLTPLSEDNIPNEIKGFVQSINQMLARTERAIQQQQRFIADAAHELRTPLTALSVQTDRIAQSTLNDGQREQIAALQNSIKRHRHLLDQLLAQARANAPEAERAAKIPHQAHELFGKIINDLLPLAEQKNQDIGITGECNPTFAMNETDAYTLIKTLTDNAIRYAPENSQIDLWADETASHIILNVEDNGTGIAASERERVLDPFYRVLGTEQDGTGLGLSIADAIAKRYGGYVQLRDSEHFAHGLWVRVFLRK